MAAPELPQHEPQECRRRAEDCLTIDDDAPRAVAWALLAIAGELHEVRRSMVRKR